MKQDRLKKDSVFLKQTHARVDHFCVILLCAVMFVAFLIPQVYAEDLQNKQSLLIRGAVHDPLKSPKSFDDAVTLNNFITGQSSEQTQSIIGAADSDLMQNPDGLSETMNDFQAPFDEANGLPLQKTLSKNKQPGESDTEYQALGIRFGSFVLYPELESHIFYTDNALLSSANQHSDRILEITPGLKIMSDWKQHSLEADITGKRQFYDIYSSEDDTNFNADIKGRLDIYKRTQLLLKGSYAYSEEARDSLDAVAGASKRTGIETGGVETELRQQFNRLTISLRGAITEKDYADAVLANGTLVNNDDRDVTEVKAILRGSYEISPRFSLIGEAEVNQLDYTQAFDDNGMNRDSVGDKLRGGFGLEFGPKLRGEILIGYMQQHPDDAILTNIEGLSLDTRLEWDISALTRLKLLIQSGIEDTTLVNTSGAVFRNFALEASHKVRRNMIVTAGLVYEIEDYSGVDVEENMLKASLGLEYLFNQNLSAKAGYRYSDFSSAVEGRDYQENRVNLGMSLRR